jgi:peptidylprolyl isomerase/peptidyl-prolyl cis-trans isomerase B (cyclophilin B)
MQIQKLATFVVMALLLVGCSTRPPVKTTTTPETPTAVPTLGGTMTYTAPTTVDVAHYTALAKTSIVRITTAKGVIDLELYPDDAPLHVANFMKLIDAGFYNNLTFHRVVADFVIQGGDPKGDGSGGPGYTIKAEFNSKKHLAGTLAMARSSVPDSAGSQFYICLGPQEFLDGNYTVFGQTVAGMDAVSKIAVGDVMTKVEILSK